MQREKAGNRWGRWPCSGIEFTDLHWIFSLLVNLGSGKVSPLPPPTPKELQIGTDVMRPEYCREAQLMFSETPECAIEKVNKGSLHTEPSALRMFYKEER